MLPPSSSPQHLFSCYAFKKKKKKNLFYLSFLAFYDGEGDEFKGTRATGKVKKEFRVIFREHRRGRVEQSDDCSRTKSSRSRESKNEYRLWSSMDPFSLAVLCDILHPLRNR